MLVTLVSVTLFKESEIERETLESNAMQSNENTVTTTEQVVGGTNNASTVRGKTNKRSPTDQPNTSFMTGLYMLVGESVARPQTLPHLVWYGTD